MTKLDCNKSTQIIKRILTKYFLTQPEINPKRLSEKVYKHVVKEILDGELPPSYRITERLLAKKLGISNMPVREAMVRLEEHHWLERVSPKMVFISKFTPDDIKKIYQMRDIYETGAIRIIGGSLNQQQLADLNDIVTALELFSDEINKESYDEADVLFHRLLVHFAGNSRLEEAYSYILLQAKCFNLVGAFRAAILSGQKVEPMQISNHRAIYDALAAKNTELAEKMIRQHLRKTYEATSMISKTRDILMST